MRTNLLILRGFNMDFKNNYDNLYSKNFTSTGKLRYLRDFRPVNPFISNKVTKFPIGFKGILGYLIRLILNEKNENIEDYTEFSETIISQILENGELSDENEKYFKELLYEYLLADKDEINILTPKFYSFIYPKKNTSNEEGIALFIRDIFLDNNGNIEKFKNFVNNSKSNNILIDLILNNINNHSGNITEKKYCCVDNEVINLFNEDFDFALKHEEWFMDNIELFFAYYYFYYNAKVIFKVNKEFSLLEDDINFVDYDEHLYYLLDWEHASKFNKTITGSGYDFLLDKSKYIYSQFTMIDHLNILIGDFYKENDDLINKEVLLLEDVYKFFNGLNEEDKNNFIHYLKKWIERCSEYHNYPLDEMPNELKELLKLLYKVLNNEKFYSSNGRSFTHYIENLENITTKYFAKSRRQFGFVLNVNKKFLLMITALSFNDYNNAESENSTKLKIKMDDLFKEYHKRGLYFDKNSEETIKELLNKLNLVDKKSDSGSAQYVRTIL